MPVEEFQIAMIPENTVEINDADQAAKLLKLVGMLEDYDDVQEVYGNFSIPDVILDKSIYECQRAVRDGSLLLMQKG